MRRIEISQFGLDHIELVTAPQVEPRDGEVVVRIRAASLNFRDFLIAQGFYNSDLQLPLVPLSDGAGEVVAVGDTVDSVSVGDRVSSVFWQTWADGPAALSKISASTGCEAPGVASEYAVLPEAAVVKLPANMSYETAACLPCAALTAWNSLKELCGTQAGHTVLLLGTGGVSLFALQFAKALGAHVIITSSSDEKLAKAKALGADHGINYKTNPEWGKAAFSLAGLGVNSVIETGGAGTLSQSIEALGWDGHIAYIGQLAGMSAELNFMGMVAKGAHLHGVMVGSRAQHLQMLDFVDAQDLSPVIHARYGLDEFGKALGAMPDGEHFGKLLISLD